MNPIKACVIGWPIAHSRSPLIHGHWLKTYGINGLYTREAVESRALPAFLASLAARGFAGCNVTVPHKEAAFAIAKIKDESALAVGAANTIWLEDGRIACANTDTYGFMTHLTVSAPQWTAARGPAAILGAGGAARAIVYGLLNHGVPEVRVFNRSMARAATLADHFGSRVVAMEWSTREAMSREASVVVNTTTLGMKGEGDPAIDFSGHDPACVVADIVYVPLETAFLRAARTAGLATVDGLGMLLHQAVPGFARWFGIRPAVTDELRAVLVRDIEGA
ncbi:MAG: shikimate dehydrogenase [Hyphomicrobium sp.]